MACDAHAHPFDLARRLGNAEDAEDIENERRRLHAACAASAWSREEFACHQGLARRAEEAGAAPVFLCFGVHPQLPALEKAAVPESLAALEEYARAEKLRGIGETGFDFYSPELRETGAVQEKIFAAHLELALERGLPLVLHVRRAMDRVFAHTAQLRRLPAVVFHAYAGTRGEGEALLRRGINAYFSFGSAILLNHREAIRCGAAFPPERLLVETDAPYQPLRGRPFSRWADLPVILQALAALRNTPAPALEAQTDHNFFQVFGPP